MLQTISWEEKKLSQNSSYSVVTLNRADKANSFNALMIDELTKVFQEIGQNKNTRFLLVQGAGENFCAGADLSWMKSSKELSLAENKADAEKLQKLFQLFAELPCVTFCLCKGSVFGGGVGLAACADFVFADLNTRFCLSEVKLGLLPAVILPFLYRKMTPQSLRYLSYTAQVFSGEKACVLGLVDKVFSANEMQERVREELNKILKNSPEALRELKMLFHTVQRENYQHVASATVDSIARVRVSEMGQHGLQSFFEKKSPGWMVSLSEDL